MGPGWNHNLLKFLNNPNHLSITYPGNSKVITKMSYDFQLVTLHTWKCHIFHVFLLALNWIVASMATICSVVDVQGKR